MKIQFEIIIDNKIVTLFRKVFNVKTIIYLIAICLFTMGLFIFSEPISKPYSFVRNEVISSAEVNENFDALYTLINEHDTIITDLLGGDHSDNSSGYIRFGDVQIAWGSFSSSLDGATSTTILPVSFINSNYRLSLTPGPAAVDNPRYTHIVNKNSNNFTAQTFTASGSRSGVSGDYVAIGKWR